MQSALSQASKTIDRLDAELLLAHVLGKTREFLIAHADDTAGRVAIWQFNNLVKKRIKGMPVAYLTGHKEFYGLDFAVNKYTLIPRPDTEIMVDLVLKRLTQIKTPVTLIDVGTGSGCIPVAIAKQQFSNLAICATDISKKALAVAIQNAKQHDVDIMFKQGNLLDPLNSEINNRQSEIVITANLPYLTEAQFQEEPSIQQEPKSALVAEEGGLALYSELLDQLSALKNPLTCYMEIDPTQTKRLQALVTEKFPDVAAAVHQDLSGKDRIISFQTN